MLSNVKAEDRVKSVLSGWGTVTHNYVNLDRDLTRVCVRFDNGQLKKFHPDGRHRRDDLNPEIMDVVRRKWKPADESVHFYANGSIVSGDKIVQEGTTKGGCGRTYQTESHAMIARRFLTPIQLRLAWLFEHCPDYDPEDVRNTWAISYKPDTETFKAVRHIKNRYLDVLYMSEYIAKDLCERLNAGQVDLWDY